MKRGIYITGFFILLTMRALAQEPSASVTLGDIAIEKDSDSVTLSLTASFDKKSTRNGASLVYIPQITDGRYTVSFPPVVVWDKRSRTIWKRSEWISAENPAIAENAIYTDTKYPLHYSCTVPFQEWMLNAQLNALRVVNGCCYSLSETSILLDRVLPYDEPEPEVFTEPEIILPEVVVEMTLADTISMIFPFVLTSSEFDPENPVKLYDDERDNAITIYFGIGSSKIDPGYAGNRQALNNLVVAIQMIKDSDRSDIHSVVVAGFSSPDGSFEVNDRLAWERAVAIKEYIINETRLPQESITVYNGSADWQGLRLLVAADRTMPERDTVLDIIDNTPVGTAQNGRIAQIRRLRGGQVYRYMNEYIFPQLRSGAFIRVYYDNKEN